VLLTVTTTMPQASDLGYLLHKHPDRVQTFTLTASTAYVFYPEATDESCTVALLLDIDPLALMRNQRGVRERFTLGQHVNDKVYVVSSLMSVALGKAFSTALSGRCNARPELVDQPIPLVIEVACLAARDGVDLPHRLFGPLGWDVDAAVAVFDPQHPEWGNSDYVNLRLTGTVRLADALNHLYVLLPVLDNNKHYWVTDAEVAKLLRAGVDWLGEHPERELITRRYLAHQPAMWRDAMAQLMEIDDVVAAEEQPDVSPPIKPLAWMRREAVLALVRRLQPRRVCDLGCGEGALLAALLSEPGIAEVVGADVSASALSKAERRLHVDGMTERQRGRLTLFQSSLLYRDQRLTNFDVAVLMEVIEHIDLDRLPVLEHHVFAEMRPGAVIVTTPNAEFNRTFVSMAVGAFRHADHRFEWTRPEFRAWARRVAQEHHYGVEFHDVGDADPEAGPATQLALFQSAAGKL
jgi:3' terminal RNA ribose 2'-O-methyltransferase Hen1